MAERIPQSLSIRVAFHAVLSSDHASPATGKTIAITISKNGLAAANPAAGATNATEIGSGAYYVDLAAADTSTLGPLVVIGTCSGVDTLSVFYDVVTLASAVAASPIPTAGTPSATNFLVATDIGNRALQHCGAKLMDSVLGFTEVSRNARQVSFAYPKLRRAELRRNIWRFATRKAVLRAIDTNTLIVSPALWVSTTIYFVGSIVADQNGTPWISLIPNNLNNNPGQSSVWTEYFGPMTVTLYDSTLSYYSGELVYTTAGDGTNRVYISLQNANSDTPATATAWAATSVYFKNQVVSYLSVAYMSLIDLNTNQTPNSSPSNWASGTTYASGNKVNGSDGVTYTSLSNGNVGNNPTSDGGVHWSAGGLTAWTTVFTGGAGSLKWLEIGGAEFPNGVALTTLNIVYPIGAGPSSQSSTRNIYRLPAGYLKTAPQDPKAGSISYLGAPGNLQYDDWNLEGNYIVSWRSDPIIFRFVADTADVPSMDDMFCEGLAARIALEVVEPLTQSSAKLQVIAKEYEKFMGEARLTNAIETGAVEPSMDDWIACRA